MHFRAMRKSGNDVSLSDSIDGGAEGAALSLMDVISDDTDLLEQVCTKESVAALRQALGTCLTAQERQVLTLRFGLDGQSPQRQRQVAETTGISRSYVSRIEKRALEKLRAALE